MPRKAKKADTPRREKWKAEWRKERGLQPIRIEERIEKLELEGLVRREAAHRAGLRRKYGDNALFSALKIAGINKIVRSLKMLPETRKKRINQLEAKVLKIADYLYAV